MNTEITHCGKIIVCGVSGSGKSTVSRMLAERTHLPLYHMDSIIWDCNWVEKEQQRIKLELAEISRTECWIVEGWIDHYSRDLLRLADNILYLDLPGWLAMWGGIQRWFATRGRKRPELPTGCQDTLNFGYLCTMLMRSERPHIEAMLAECDSDKILRLKSRSEIKQILDLY